MHGIGHGNWSKIWGEFRVAVIDKASPVRLKIFHPGANRISSFPSLARLALWCSTSLYTMAKRKNFDDSAAEQDSSEEDSLQESSSEDVKLPLS